jgi:hypothetical protein
MTGNPANPLVYAEKALFAKQGLCLRANAVVFGRNTKKTLQSKSPCFQMHHPLPYYSMWRGNTLTYRYNKYQSSNWGEGATNAMYHQHYAHAKDPTDYGRSGREFEFLRVSFGKMIKKPMPVVQYVKPDSKPVWNFKSWHAELGTATIWQREVQYPEHIPEHIGANRPLCNLAPSTLHKRIHLAHIDKITITICPLLFGFGHTMQKSVIDFYRHCLATKTIFPEEKVFMYYTLDHITPKIEVTWIDGSVFSVPVFEFGTSQEYIQMVMERSFLVADRISATGKTVQPLPIDDFKWQEMLAYKKKKKKEDAAGGAKK